MNAPAVTILGRHVHEATSRSVGREFFDAIDVVVHADDGPVVFGFRTEKYIRNLDSDGDEVWADGYQPLAVTLDRSRVNHWDFNRTLWVGPDPHPCLVWSNAEAISLDGLRNLFSWTDVLRPDEISLPSPADLGLHGWDDRSPGHDG